MMKVLIIMARQTNAVHLGKTQRPPRSARQVLENLVVRSMIRYVFLFSHLESFLIVTQQLSD